MTPLEIESLDNDAMNGRVAGLVSRYWHRQGYRVEVGAKEGPVWSNLRCGLPPGYRGQDAMPLASVALGIATRIKRGAGQSRERNQDAWCPA
jgi:hypothetical protein